MTHTHVTRMLKSTTATSPTSVESRSEKHPPKWGVGTVKATTGRKATRLAFVTGHWQRVPEALEVAPPGRRWRRLKMRLQCDTWGCRTCSDCPRLLSQTRPPQSGRRSRWWGRCRGTRTLADTRTCSRQSRSRGPGWEHTTQEEKYGS